MSFVDAINGLTDALNRLSVQPANGEQTTGVPANSTGAAPQPAAPVDDRDWEARRDEAYVNSLPTRDLLREESLLAFRAQHLPAAAAAAAAVPALTVWERIS